MPFFSGSAFFSDNEFLKKRKFLASNYGTPLFNNSKFDRSNNYNEKSKLFLRKQLRRYYKRNVEICREKVQPIANMTKSVCTRPNNSFVTPAPNRYQIKGKDIADIVNKQTGTIGPYSCFTGARDETSYYGHMATKVGHTPICAKFYYDLPREMERLMLPRNNFVMKIRRESVGSQKTYMRSMIDDLTLCPKDPQLPGPDKYYPQNFAKKKSYKSQRKDKKYIFHFGTFIPEGERFTSMKSLQPGPGRYHPPIACPCKCGTEYRKDGVTNIPGKGFTSVFKSNTKRLLEKPTFKESSKIISKHTEIPNMLHQKYVLPIRALKRQTLSFRQIKKEDKKPNDIKFNTTATTLPRRRLRANKAVAFMSSCPRFKDDGGKDTFLANRNILISSGKSMSNANLNKKITERTNSATRDLQRLLKLPQRYVLNRKDKIGYDKLQNIFHIPSAKIFLK